MEIRDLCCSSTRLVTFNISQPNYLGPIFDTFLLNSPRYDAQLPEVPISTIRFYAQHTSLSIFDSLFQSWFLRFNFICLPSARLTSTYSLEEAVLPSDVSVMIIREVATDREQQQSRFLEMIYDVITNTKFKTLVLVFSTFFGLELETRKKLYQSLFPLISIEYFNIYRIPSQEELISLKKTIYSFSQNTNFIREIYEEFCELYELFNTLCLDLQKRKIVGITSNILEIFHKIKYLKIPVSSLSEEHLRYIKTFKQHIQELSQSNASMICVPKIVRVIGDNLIPFLVSLIKITSLSRNCVVCGLKCRKMCSDCEIISYCDVEHQSKDWKRHKYLCRTYGELKKVRSKFDEALQSFNERKTIQFK